MPMLLSMEGVMPLAQWVCNNLWSAPNSFFIRISDLRFIRRDPNREVEAWSSRLNYLLDCSVFFFYGHLRTVY
jgi:hypothetical protein